VIVCVALLLIGCAWSLASPRFSGPDEPSHFIKSAAVVRGELRGAQATRSDGVPTGEVQVPARLGSSGGFPSCYAFNPAQPAGCAPSEFDGSTDDAAIQTTAWPYTPVYYALVGWPTLFDTTARSAWFGRFASAAITALLVAWATDPLRRRLGGRFAIGTVLVTVSPMVLFLSGLFNPNGMEVAAAIGVLAHGSDVLGPRDPPRRAAWGLGVSGALLALTRPLSPAFLVVLLALLLLRAPWPRVRAAVTRRDVQVAGAAMGISLVLAGLWTVTTGAPPFPGPLPAEGIPVWVDVMGRSGAYLEEMVGVLGWRDTASPSGIVMLWYALVGALALGGLVVGSVRDRLTIAAAVAGTLLLPFSQVLSAETQGLPWQGRYTLPLAVAVPIFGALALAPRLKSIERDRAGWMLLGAASVGHVMVFYQGLRRYLVGLPGDWWVLDDDGWIPPLAPWVLIAIVVGALGLVALAAWLDQGPALVGVDEREADGPRTGEVAVV
jgi:hypothetical protein